MAVSRKKSSKRSDRKIPEEITEAEEHFRIMADSIPLIIWVTDLDSRIQFINRAYSNFFGVTLEEAQESGWRSLVHPEDSKTYANEYLTALREQKPFRTEARIRRGDGAWRWVESHGAPRFSSSGEFLGMVGSSLDTTERKEAEEELKKASNELERRVEQRTAALLLTNARLKEENEERLRAEQSLRLEEARLDALLRLSQMSEAPDAELASFVLENGIALTQSKIGFVGFLNEDETIYTLHAVSKDVVKECNVAGDPLQWHVAEAGIWADAIRERRTVFVNDYSKPHASKKGLPPGHPPVSRLMVVPISDGKRIVAVAGMGNKASDYDESDEQQITLLLHGLWHQVQRSRSGEALKEAYDELEQRVEQRTAELTKSNTILQKEVNERKKAEEKLIETERDLKRAQAVAQTGSWQLDIHSNELLWSDETYRMFGIPKGTPMTYDIFLSSVHPDDREYVDNKWQAALQGENYDIEHRIILGSEVKWIREKAELEFDKQGILKGGFGTAQDITKRKEMEAKIEELLEERSRQLQYYQTNFALLVNTMAEGVVVVDNQGRVLFGNPAAAAIFNIPEKELMDYRLEIPGALGITEIELPLGQQTRTIELNAVEVNWNGERAYLATLRDITEQKHAAEMITTLSHRLLEAQEKERREIGHELHDEIGGALTAVKLALGRAKKKLGEKSESELNKVDEMLGEMMDMVSTLSQNMRPDILSDFGLAEALKWHFARYTEQTGIKVHFKQKLAARRYTETIETTTYRIIQEALTNVARYAGVKEVRVSVHSDSEKLYIQVEDRGHGFVPQQVEGAPGGISGMQDRAFLVGGDLVVDSSPGRGTSVSCELPLSSS